jgi:hypothetical protein
MRCGTDLPKMTTKTQNKGNNVPIPKKPSMVVSRIDSSGVFKLQFD